MSKVKKTVLLVAGICAAAGILLTGAAIGLLHSDFSRLDWRADPLEAVTYTISEPFDALDIRTASWDVRLCPSPDGVCRVEGWQSEHLQLTAAVINGTLTVTQSNSRRWYDNLVISFSGQTDHPVTVYLPQENDSALTVKTASGDIAVPDTLSFTHASLTCTSGDIVCAASVSESLRAVSTSGEVRLQNLMAESVEARSTSGDVKLQNLTADSAEVKSTSGDVALRAVGTGTLAAETTSGDISLTDTTAAGEMTLSAVSGDVELCRADAASLRIKTTSGEVEGSLLSPKCFSVSTSSGWVRVPTSDPNAGQCLVNTVSGDVELTLAENNS